MMQVSLKTIMGISFAIGFGVTIGALLVVGVADTVHQYAREMIPAPAVRIDVVPHWDDPLLEEREQQHRDRQNDPRV